MNAINTLYEDHVATPQQLVFQVLCTCSAFHITVLRHEVFINSFLGISKTSQVAIQEGTQRDNWARKESLLQFEDLLWNALAEQEVAHLIAEMIAAVREQVVGVKAGISLLHFGLQPANKLLMSHEGVPKSHHRQFRLLLRPIQLDAPRTGQGLSELLPTGWVAAEKPSTVPVFRAIHQHAGVNGLCTLPQQQWSKLGSHALGDVVQENLHGLFLSTQDVGHDFPEVHLAVHVDICICKNVIHHLSNLVHLALLFFRDLAVGQREFLELPKVLLKFLLCDITITVLVPLSEFGNQLLKLLWIPLHGGVQVLSKLSHVTHIFVATQHASNKFFISDFS
mmetsp:Transcript_54064/g.88131  ORF Transcript_54064/g.88131 Transcript_54064/m.88131 type:complete len:337 (-) Transcript_54064:62-1072(-)